MTRGKKVVSKIGQSSAGELCKALCYVTSDGREDETIGATNLKVMQEISEDTSGEQPEGPEDVTVTVSSHRNQSFSLQ